MQVLIIDALRNRIEAGPVECLEKDIIKKNTEMKRD